jgi:hypothetical protein
VQQPERLFDVLVAARLKVREADFVELAVDRPEVCRLHLAAAGLASLDRGLIHRDDPPGPDRGQLRLVDGFEQSRGLLHELRQPGAAQVEARVDQALVLTVQRQMPAELVHQHAGDEADVGATALDDTGGRRRAMQGLGVAALDHGPHILQHHEASRTLGQAVADLLADDLVLLGAQPGGLGVGHRDGLDGHLGLVEE